MQYGLKNACFIRLKLTKINRIMVLYSNLEKTALLRDKKEKSTLMEKRDLRPLFVLNPLN